MNIKAEYIVGQNSGNDWSGFYGYIPDESSNTKTELLCVARLKTDATDVELERIAGMLLDEFQDAYYNFNSEEDEIVKLEESFQKMKTKLEVIVSREDSILEKGLDIEMTIALVNEDMLVVGVIGESKILIFRNDKLVDISKGLVDANMLGFVRTGSLNLLAEDRVLLTTSNPFNLHYSALEKAVRDLSINHLSEVSEDRASAVLLFADESLSWNKQESSTAMSDTPVASVSLEQKSTESTSNQDNNGLNQIENLDYPSELELVNNQVYENIPQNSAVSSSYSYPDFAEESNTEVDLAEEPVSTNINIVTSKQSKILNSIKSMRNIFPKRLPKVGVRYGADSEQIPTFDNESEEEASQKQERNEIFNRIRSSASNLKSKFTSKNNIEESREFTSDKTYQQVIKRILNSLRNLLNKAIDFLKTDVVGLNTSRLDKRKNAAKLKRNRVILAVVLIVFVLLIYVAWRDADTRRQDAEKVQAASTKIAQIESDVSQSVGQVETVKNQDQNKKDILSSRLTTLQTTIDNQKKEGLFIEQLDKLSGRIKNAKDSLLFIKEVNDTNLQVVTDVGRIFQDTNLSDMVLVNGQLYLSDAKRNVIYKSGTSINSDSQEVVKNLVTPSHMVKDASNNIIVYDSDTTSAMSVLKTSDNSLTRLTGLSPAVIGTVSEVALYGNNNALYELHQNHQQIFKRDRLGETYSGGGAIYVTINPPNWRTDPEFAKAIDVSVPYEIYVLIEGMGLKRYLAGGNNTLEFATYQNLSQADFDSIKQATSFDTDGKYLAISDLKGKRVMVFEIIENDQKNLKLLQQFVYRGGNNIFGSIKELAVDASSNSVYVLDGTKVVKVAL